MVRAGRGEISRRSILGNSKSRGKTMRLKIALATSAITFCSSAVNANLEIYKDYTVSDAPGR
jgi:hypothetical protein